MLATTKITTTRTVVLRFTKKLLQRKPIQERQIARQNGQMTRKHQNSDRDQKNSADNFDGMQMTTEATVEREKAINPKRGQQERNREPGGVNGQQQDAFQDAVFRRGKGKNRCQ